MRESLICIGKIGEKGYYFEDTGIQIFSYEELCYYMSQHMICYIHTLPGEDLLAYIRDELDLDKLSKQLSGKRSDEVFCGIVPRRSLF